MISTFSSTGGMVIHSQQGITVEGGGDAVIVRNCTLIKAYEIIYNRIVKSQCYRNFPFKYLNSSKVFLFQVADIHFRQEVHY